MTLDKLRNKASERVGVIAAMPVEARALGASEPFNQILELTSNTYAYVCGAGPDNARRAMQELLTMNVAGVVSWGTAGGLTPNLVPGTALLSKKVICADSAYETDGYWAGRLRDHFNSILTINDEAIYSSGQLVSGMAEKKRLANETGAVAVDMESGAIAKTAVAAGVPFVCVRAVADPFDFSLPGALSSALDEKGFPTINGALQGLLRRPADIVPMLRLAVYFRKATRTLTVMSRVAGPGLLGP